MRINASTTFALFIEAHQLLFLYLIIGFAFKGIINIPFPGRSHCEEW